MKKALIGLAAGAALTVAAGAANADGYGYGSVKDAPITAPQVNWNGLYIGAAVGYGIASTELDARLEEWDGSYYNPGSYELDSAHSANLDGLSSKGFQGVLTLGYDRQIHSNFLLGVFADYAFGDLETNASIGFSNEYFGIGGRLNAEISNSWAIGARLGYVHSPSTMWYLTAGYAQADLDWKITGFIEIEGDRESGVIGSGGKSLSGWFIGGGVEHQLRDNLFIKLDYRYTNYDTERLLSADWEEYYGPDQFHAHLDSQTDVHTVRLGVNWKVDLFHGRHAHSEPLK